MANRIDKNPSHYRNDLSFKHCNTETNHVKCFCNILISIDVRS